MNLNKNIGELFNDHAYELYQKQLKIERPLEAMVTIVSETGKLAGEFHALQKHHDEGQHVVREIRRSLKQRLIRLAVICLAFAELIDIQEGREVQS